jgi:hypothetical protein
MIKPIHKFNNGRGATLCHCCSKIINTGLTEALYCNEICEQKYYVLANWEIDQYYEQMDEEVHQNKSNLNK